MNTIHLGVKSIGKTPFSLDVASTVSIETLKQTIETLHEIPVDEQRLLFQGKFLENDLFLSDYGLVNECTVLLVRGAPRKTEILEPEPEPVLSAASQELLDLVRGGDDSDSDSDEDDLYDDDDDDDDDDEETVTSSNAIRFSDEALYRNIIRRNQRSYQSRRLQESDDVLSTMSESTIYSTSSTLFEIEITENGWKCPAKTSVIENCVEKKTETKTDSGSIVAFHGLIVCLVWIVRNFVFCSMGLSSTFRTICLAVLLNVVILSLSMIMTQFSNKNKKEVVKTLKLPLQEEEVHEVEVREVVVPTPKSVESLMKKPSAPVFRTDFWNVVRMEA